MRSISFPDRGVFFIDNGHSFDAITFYGNELLLFIVELLLFLCIVVICGNFLFAILCVGVVSKVGAQAQTQLGNFGDDFSVSDFTANDEIFREDESIQADADR